MLSDFHLHTLVSDGELDPLSLLREAARRGIERLSITDHDSLGAYSWEDGGVFAEAERLGQRLTVGIEMDADLEGKEVHVLGLDLALDEPALRSHLAAVREARQERSRREIGLVNALLGPGAIEDGDIFVVGRETLMRPHFVHPLLEKGLFPTYEAASRWYRENVKAGVTVPKPRVGEAIALIHGAGGWASLAHPGYYEREGVAVLPRLAALREAGLDAIELDYPYHACSPHVFGLAEERAYVAGLREAAEPLGFRFTRGSDCHTAADFDRRYGGA